MTQARRRLPDQRTGSGEGLVVDHVDGDDAPTGRAFLGEARRPAPGLQLDEVDQPDAKPGLRGKVAAYVGLGHRRDRVHRHGRVTVEAINAVASASEEGSEGLPAADLGRGHQHRGELAGGKGDFGGGADRPDRRCAVEGRNTCSAERALEGRHKVADAAGSFVRIQSHVRVGVTGEADGAGIREVGEHRGRRRLRRHRGEASKVRTSMTRPNR